VNTHALSSRLTTLASLTDERMRRVVQIGKPPFRPLGAMEAYHLGWYDAELEPLARPAAVGKRLRPALCLLVCEGLSGALDAAMGVAAAIELVHNFSLVHDDIQDRSRTRRGRPTVWARWGGAQAINVGDALFASAQLAIMGDTALPADARVESAAILARACLLLVEGQYLDLALQGRPATFEQYDAMVGRKTAALLAASAELGAVCGGGDSAVRESYRQFGLSLGLAFQYQDDVLGVWGDPRVTGKSAAADVRSAKQGLPAVLAFQRAEGSDADELKRIYSLSRRDRGAIAAVKQLFDRLDVRDAAEGLVAERYSSARQWLATAPGSSESRRLLSDLVDSLEVRSF
jgi:geranylgeranyl diphosphate synthase, type I